MEVQHKKNTPAYIGVPMLEAGNPALFKSGLTVTSSGYYRDEGGAWTAFVLGTPISEIGTSGIYDLYLSAAEMDHDKVVVKLSAPGAADTGVAFNTVPKPSTSSLDGDGSILVNHDYGGTDALKIVDQFGVGIDNATVRVYTADDYNAGSTELQFVVAETRTDVNGRWESSLMLDPGDYVLLVFKQKVAAPQAIELTVE